MNLESLAKNKLALLGGVAVSVFAAFELSSMANEALSGLPVIIPAKVSAPATPSKPDASKPPIVHQVLAKPSGQPNTTPSLPFAISDAQLDRLFSLEKPKSELDLGSGPPNPALQIPSPGAAGGASPDGAPPGAPTAGVGKNANPAAPPANSFRVDGIASGGAFITGRFFRIGAELEGIAFPVTLAPGEKVTLGPVSAESITIMLGNRPIVLTKPKE